jgi:asparagine synthase (glutamine-hydrolysing)
MCGIAGIVRRHGTRPGDGDAMARMLRRMVHRGPDDAGSHITGQIAMGMRRLSIIDLAGGHQPIANEDESVWIVCNGEIYGFRELRAKLEGLGHRFRTHSDSEVALHAYEAFGLDFLDHLDGMFGLAIWDARQGRLVLARDRMGIKPLYYVESGGDLYFASELKSLQAAGAATNDLDPVALQEYLTLGYAVAPRTLLARVRKLPPATALIWSRTGSEVRPYWALPQQVDDAVSEADWIERIRETFVSSVRKQMVSDVPVGAFLSGGIDSSGIVSVMASLSDAPIRTYAIGYRHSEYFNELPFAHAVAERYGTRHREILVEPQVTDLLPLLMHHLEEPISDTAILTTYLVSKLAAEEVKVIMSGVGGDELFAGYTRYLGDYYGAQYRRLPRWARGLVIEPLAERLPSGRSNRLLDLSRYVKQFVRNGRLDWHDQYKGYVQLAQTELLHALAESGVDADGFDLTADAVTSADPALRLFTVDWRTQLPEALLLLTDKMTMANSLECRVPFLDRELVELAASIPASIKLKGGRLKHLLKRALEDYLPPEVVRRRKRGFGAPMGQWLQRDLSGLRSVLLSDASVRRRGLLAPDAVRRVCALHDTNKEDHTDLLLVLMNLEIWCRLFLDGASPGDVAEQLREQTEAA